MSSAARVRRTLESGLVDEGRALFGVLHPKRVGRPGADAFTRDLGDLTNPIAAVAAAKAAQVAPAR